MRSHQQQMQGQISRVINAKERHERILPEPKPSSRYYYTSVNEFDPRSNTILNLFSNPPPYLYPESSRIPSSPDNGSTQLRLPPCSFLLDSVVEKNECQFCSRHFTNSGNLKRHQRTHRRKTIQMRYVGGTLHTEVNSSYIYPSVPMKENLRKKHAELKGTKPKSNNSKKRKLEESASFDNPQTTRRSSKRLRLVEA